MQGLERVVVGVDLAASDRPPPRTGQLSPACHAALDRALRLAAAGHRGIDAVYVAEADDAARELLVHGAGHGFVASIERRLDELIASARVSGAAVRHVVAFGRPWKVLLNAVAADRADVLVVGTPVRGPSEGRVLGSNALELVRRSPVPVWVERPGLGTIRTIVAAVDDDAAAPEVVRTAAGVAAELKAALDVVTVVDDAPERLLRGAGVTGDSLERYRIRRMEAAQTLLASLAETAQTSVPDTRVHVLRGDPATAVAAHVGAARASLLVLGKVAHEVQTEPRTGPTAERLLALVEASILVTSARP